MASFGIGSWFRPWLVLLVLAASCQPSLAQICTFWDMGCIDPFAQTAVSVSLPPLFLEDVSLYYAFDVNSQGKGRGPMTKSAFWLGYDSNPRINSSVIDANRTSEVGMRVGNLTGTPGGGNNGCDNIWGPRCSRDLIDLIKGNIFALATSGNYYSYPLDAVLHEMLAAKPALSNCAPSLWDVQDIWVDYFVQESVADRTATIQTPGDSDSPWRNFLLDGLTASQQAEQVAVAIFSRAPSYDSGPPETKDEIDVNLVCVQAPSSGSSSSSDD
ncbi:hypothetical protein ASPWEDRAFT_112969 [Aspergillus wentii DTO 134E9]|uniref:Heme haloperoxidase family profile domain-containing protein n=1 Tax=Aspergillus wentii DTO 134E9 TaxID=1073089 RepID=A0A1L9RFV7_ASPWE|nr:uncharacterized protein ASPWEDRAFT_112969 [Aspergillus wentii DTO 134E9]OJJ33784.1 hypothetical protein ASPWEDRAFT_112969 [Aspergillus wentii DTO 134E9]